jgi:hypothetical protein
MVLSFEERSELEYESGKVFPDVLREAGISLHLTKVQTRNSQQEPRHSSSSGTLVRRYSRLPTTRKRCGCWSQGRMNSSAHQRSTQMEKPLGRFRQRAGRLIQRVISQVDDLHFAAMPPTVACALTQGQWNKMTLTGLKSFLSAIVDQDLFFRRGIFTHPSREDPSQQPTQRAVGCVECCRNV